MSNGSKKRTFRELIEEREKQLATEKPFAYFGADKVPIKESDIALIGRVIGFSMKYVGMSDLEAFEYAMHTFVLLRIGTGKEKENAETTAQSAFSWEWDTFRTKGDVAGDFMGFIKHRNECFSIFNRFFWAA